jgi:hypothetical protein
MHQGVYVRLWILEFWSAGWEKHTTGFHVRVSVRIRQSIV